MRPNIYTDFTDLANLTHSCNIAPKETIQEPTLNNQIKFNALQARLTLTIKDREFKNFLFNSYLANMASLLGASCNKATDDDI